jgi:hypothetical protein
VPGDLLPAVINGGSVPALEFEHFSMGEGAACVWHD